MPLPPPYFREIWDFENVNIEFILKSISNFDWKRAFCNQNCNEKCKYFIKNINKFIL